MKFTPKFDQGFNPISIVLRDYKEQVAKEENKLLKICVERNDGYNYIYKLNIFTNPEKNSENYKIAERIIKSFLVCS